MKKALSVIFAMCLLQAVLLGCGEDTCPPEPHSLEPFYINNSGVDVKLSAVEVKLGSVPIYDTIQQEIKNNDTLCNNYMDTRGYSCATPNWLIADGNKGLQTCDYYCDPYFKVEFLSEPKVCIVFHGEDKVENDMRYWESYTFAEKNYDTSVYHYYITPELMRQAREEHCQ